MLSEGSSHGRVVLARATGGANERPWGAGDIGSKARAMDPWRAMKRKARVMNPWGCHETRNK